MSDRVQLKHALIDVTFTSKPVVRALRRKYGWLSVLWLIEVILSMSSATRGRISDDTALCIAEDMGLQNGEDIIAYCLEAIDSETQHTILQRESGLLTNSRVIKDQESCATEREKARNRQRKTRDNIQDNDDVTCDIRVTSTDSHAGVTRTSVPVPDTVTDTKIIELKNSDFELDAITREQTLMAYHANGLSVEDIPRAKQIVIRYWQKPTVKRRSSDIFSSWVIQELQKEKLGAKKLGAMSSNGQGPPLRKNLSNAFNLITSLAQNDTEKEKDQ